MQHTCKGLGDALKSTGLEHTHGGRRGRDGTYDKPLHGALSQGRTAVALVQGDEGVVLLVDVQVLNQAARKEVLEAPPPSRWVLALQLQGWCSSICRPQDEGDATRFLICTTSIGAQGRAPSSGMHPISAAAAHHDLVIALHSCSY